MMKRLVLLSYSHGNMCKRVFRHRFDFSSEKQFQQELGLKNKITTMGRIKRFERRKPTMARIVKFIIIFIALTSLTLSVTPGSSLPFQKNYKLTIYHMKAWFNNFWNLQIGKEKQKYLYLLLEDLLAEMTEHQIYDVKQMQRVFGQVERVWDEEYAGIRARVQSQVREIGKERYLDVKKDAEKVNVKVKIDGGQNKIADNSKIQIVQKDVDTKKSKRALLKEKLRNEIEKKQASDQKKSGQPVSMPVKNIIETPQKLQNNQPEPAKKLPQKSTLHQSLQTHLSSSLMTSVSFRYNLLLYYILILQNCIRYETKILNNKEFYQVFFKGLEKFFFGDQGKSLVKGLEKEDSNIREFGQTIERKMSFESVVKGTMTVQYGMKDDNQAIDPHKILTYLINYRHLLQNNPKGKTLSSPAKISQTNAQMPPTSNTLQTPSNEQSPANKQNPYQPLNNLLNCYIKLFHSTQNLQQNKNHRASRFTQPQQKLISLGINNKQFVKSLKQLYLESKQTEGSKQKSQSKAKVPDQKTQLKGLNAEVVQIHQNIVRIFQIYDQWYRLNHEKLAKI